MLIKDIVSFLENLFPTYYSEEFDNTGLLVGNPDTKVQGVLITLDTLESIVDEAIQKKCNLIISYHPILFSPLKKINEEDYVERTITKAIQHNIAIYAIHTALDNAENSISDLLATQLGLSNLQKLIPKKNVIKKLTFYIPKNKKEKVLHSLYEAGAGKVGNYDNCSFQNKGIGSFKGNANSNPTIGKPNELQLEKEVQIHITYLAHKEKQILKALFENHPYEEVAYEVIGLENSYPLMGMGTIGTLAQPLSEKKFLSYLKEKIGISYLRYSSSLKKNIQKIAVVCGSGSTAINYALRANVDAFLTADLKYHDFFKVNQKVLLVDIGHYESEQFIKSKLYHLFSKKFSTFAVHLSKINTNPVNYI